MEQKGGRQTKVMQSSQILLRLFLFFCRPSFCRQKWAGLFVGFSISAATLPAADETPRRAAPAAWADGGLPVHEGLAVWFDASVQAEARRENLAPSLPSG